MVATYGSSETCGGCVYDGVPLDGVEIDVDGHEDGRIRIRGPVLFDGYDGDPELTAATLVDGWFVTSDLGRVDDGRLRVLGRVDDVVISGGVNVPTPAVARRLRAEHPGLLLPIPGNYYDDLEARYDVDPALRELGVLYDRDEHGEFLHLYTVTVGGVFFEIVQRIGGYRGFGAVNAPIRLAVQRASRSLKMSA